MLNTLSVGEGPLMPDPEFFLYYRSRRWRVSAPFVLILSVPGRLPSGELRLMFYCTRFDGYLSIYNSGTQ